MRGTNRRPCPSFESLEDRGLLTALPHVPAPRLPQGPSSPPQIVHAAPPPISIAVKSLSDSGPGSLRLALESAAAEPGPRPVVIDLRGLSGTITLENPLSPGIPAWPVQIVNASRVTLDGENQTRLLELHGGDWTIFGLRFEHGRAQGVNGEDGAGGSGGFGGAVLQDGGRLRLFGVRFLDNSAVGGSGGTQILPLSASPIARPTPTPGATPIGPTGKIPQKNSGSLLSELSPIAMGGRGGNGGNGGFGGGGGAGGLGGAGGTVWASWLGEWDSLLGKRSQIATRGDGGNGGNGGFGAGGGAGGLGGAGGSLSSLNDPGRLTMPSGAPGRPGRGGPGGGNGTLSRGGGGAGLGGAIFVRNGETELKDVTFHGNRVIGGAGGHPGRGVGPNLFRQRPRRGPLPTQRG